MVKHNRVTTTLVLALAAGAGSSAPGRSDRADPLAVFTHRWSRDRIWDDGKAEYCLYDSTGTIYGIHRHYQARLYTNKEVADPRTKTKSQTHRGRQVFKHHLVEVIATENYDYKFSTMCYVGVRDLKSLKIDMSTQDDCGASFKQFVNHAGTLSWNSFVYFPGAGHQHGHYEPPAGFAFQDALSLILRGYPFQNPVEPFELQLLPDQTSPRITSAQPGPAVVTYGGTADLDLPIGKVKAHLLTVRQLPHVVHDYWFAVSPQRPWLHVMVQYEGPGGVTHRLREHRRWAYWKR